MPHDFASKVLENIVGQGRKWMEDRRSVPKEDKRERGSRQLMKPSDLLYGFDFHDSLVENISLDESRLIIRLELCNWKQEGIQQTDNEMQSGQLIFFGVKEFAWRPEYLSLNSAEILEIKVDNEDVTIVLLGQDDVMLVTFEATEVILDLIAQ